MTLLPEFESLLKQTLGLDAASIGSSAVERAVNERLAVCQLKDPGVYWERVNACAVELQELMEAVVVPETWFFRDREAFAALANLAVKERKSAQPRSKLHLLSLPCSTGEEAYSMAIALLDAGLAPDRFSIDALDISSRALAHARRAVYGKNSFRGQKLGFRATHFEATPQGHRLKDAARRQVQFRQANIFDPELLPGVELYDIIFCRNLLIYFDRPTQDRAIAILLRLLKTNGVLFVGSAETSLLLNHGMVSTKVPMAFAFHKAGIIATRAKKTEVAREALFKPVPAPPAPVPFSTPLPDSEPPRKIDLDDAARLADQGNLVEAATTCEAFLRNHGPSARAFHLLGLVRDAAGQHDEAAGFYRKALYLEPAHLETLLHLNLLLEKQGDAAGAKILSERIHRLEEREKA